MKTKSEVSTLDIEHLDAIRANVQRFLAIKGAPIAVQSRT
jgi:hypothetical protein